MTHTYVLLELPAAVHAQVKEKFEAAGYKDQIGDNGELDMHGIAITAPEQHPEAIDSPLLGKTRPPTNDERVLIEKLVNDTPLGVFQVLNKALNQRGFLIVIDTKEGRH